MVEFLNKIKLILVFCVMFDILLSEDINVEVNVYFFYS